MLSAFLAYVTAAGLNNSAAPECRYFLEGIRPEIQQYLIEPEDNAAPYSRAMRNTIYQRAKMKVGTDTHSLGTRRDVYKPGANGILQLLGSCALAWQESNVEWSLLIRHPFASHLLTLKYTCVRI